MEFAEKLEAKGLKSGLVYVSPLMKGHEAARMVADCMAQEDIRAAHKRVIEEAEPASENDLIERLSRFYHSEHVKVCQPWILETPYDKWLARELAKREVVVR